MRKYFSIGIVALLAMSIMAAGVIYAQEETATPTAPATAWLGVALVQENDQVIIARVQPGSPADTAELQIGDVVTSYNGEAITTVDQIVALVQAAAPGDTASLELSRSGDTITVDVALGTAPDNLRGRGQRFGFTQTFEVPVDLVATWAEHALVADLEQVDGGYQVLDVLNSNNPFSLEVGDVITAVNDLPVIDLDIQALAESVMTMDQPAVTLTVTRGSETVTLQSDAMGMIGGHGMMDGMPMPFGGGRGQGQPGGMQGQGGMHQDGGRGGRGQGNNNPPAAGAAPTEAAPATQEAGNT